MCQKFGVVLSEVWTQLKYSTVTVQTDLLSGSRRMKPASVRTLIPAAVTNSGTAKQPPNSSAHYTMRAVAWRGLLLNVYSQGERCMASGCVSLRTSMAAAESISVLFLREFRAVTVNCVLPKSKCRQTATGSDSHFHFYTTPCAGSLLLNHDIQSWLACK